MKLSILSFLVMIVGQTGFIAKVAARAASSASRA
jgi:hypothetical protein